MYYNINAFIYLIKVKSDFSKNGKDEHFGTEEYMHSPYENGRQSFATSKHPAQSRSWKPTPVRQTPVNG